MSFLIDTNVISELRKGDRCAPRVWKWRQSVALEDMFTSVLVIGEIRRGIEEKRARDPISTRVFEKWLDQLQSVHRNRILPVTVEICDVWGRLSVRSPLPHIDGLLAATAIFHNLTLVTRNITDVKRSGARCLDPFVPQT
jgi:predicted nucleic acid-binding protein